MPTVKIDKCKVTPAGAKADAPKASGRDPKLYTDADSSLYPEAVAHILKPKRQRAIVSSDTLDAMRRSVSKP